MKYITKDELEKIKMRNADLFVCVYQSAFFPIVRYYLQAMTYPYFFLIEKFVNFEKLVVLMSIFI